MTTALGLASDIPRPKLFKSTSYPPVTAEEKAMWDWWHAMERADPKFEWKMPIEFYGQVVDQTGLPVSAATIHYGWTTVIGPKTDPEAETVTGADGRFAITGIRGKRLVVWAAKTGYGRTSSYMGSYEYAAFHDELFHVPDKKHPVVFRLQNLAGAESMYKYDTVAHVPWGGQNYLDVETGKFKTEGDILIQVSPGNANPAAKGEYNITLKAEPGAGFIITNDESMVTAPDTGYANAVVLKNPPDDTITARLYVKSRSGKFAAMILESRLWLKFNEAHVDAIIYFNPSGSHSVAFDHRKWLNP